MEKLKTRVRHLELEQERVQRRIDETRERTRQVETAKRRTTMMSESASESANQLNGHLDERRQSLALQRGSDRAPARLRPCRRRAVAPPCASSCPWPDPLLASSCAGRNTNTALRLHRQS